MYSMAASLAERTSGSSIILDLKVAVVLRHRYAPDWVPSWWGTDKLADLFEDAKSIFVRATKTSSLS